MSDDTARRAAQLFVVDQVSRLVTTEDWQAMLRDAGRFREYSARNTMLLALQGAQGRVAGYRAWQSVPSADGGYCQVRAGARSLKILAPILARHTSTDAATGEERQEQRPTGWRLVSVFDEEQLVVAPEPPKVMPRTLDGAAPAALWDALAAQVAAADYDLVERDVSPANGVTDFVTRTVAVRGDLPPLQRVKTLTHELAHVHLHHEAVRPEGMTRALAEVEAESVAFVVLAGIGVDASSYTLPYVARWADGNPELVASTATRVVDAARMISDALAVFLDKEHTMTLNPDDDVDLGWSIETRAGVWHIGPHPHAPGLLAQHLIDGHVNVELGRDAPVANVSALERALGFAIPQALADELRTATPPSSASMSASTALERIELAPSEQPPDDASLSGPNGAIGSYRALLDAEVIDRCYRDDSVTIETWALDAHGLAAYRITLGAGTVVAAGEVTLPGVDAASDAAIRAIAAHEATDPGLDDRVRLTLMHLASPPSEPFEPGTRVAVRDDVSGEQMLGTVVSALVADDRLVGYEWRPDAAELVGHPWRGHAHTRTALAADVEATLLPPDRGLRVDGALCFGASVRTEEGAYMVLRCFETDNHQFVYDLQPVDGGPPQRVSAAEIAEVAAGTGWRYVDDVLVERLARGIAVLPGERIDTTAGVAWIDADGRVCDQRDPTVTILPMQSMRGEEGLLAGVDDRHLPPPAVVKVDLQGDTARIGDPRHGWLAVDRGRFLAALDIPGAELAAQLRASNKTERTLDGHEPHITLAALAVQHLDITPIARHADTTVEKVQRDTPAIELTL